MNENCYYGVSVLQAFRVERRLVLMRGSIHNSRWMHYNGGEVASFKAYMRWSHDRIVLANIQGGRCGFERGRMPVILDALRELAGYITVECVLTQRFASYLERNGFKLVNGTLNDFYWQREQGDVIYETLVYGDEELPWRMGAADHS